MSLHEPPAPPPTPGQAPVFPALPVLIGLDIETDTAVDGLDPAVGRVLAVAVTVGHEVLVFDDADERLLLGRVDEFLSRTEPGVLVTWNGAGFDLPYLATRAQRLGLDLGLRLRLDPALDDHHEPLAGHAGAYRASWYRHRHLDAYRADRAELGDVAPVPCSLKAVARLAGLEPIEVDTTRVHELSPADRAAYVVSDARCTAELARRQWPSAVGVDRPGRRHRGPTMTAVPEQDPQPRRPPTATSNFGVGRREGHDATVFYERFTPPVISNDATVSRQPVVNWIQTLDARAMAEGTPSLKANSVALVVTSPPYFAGKAYEEALGDGHIPASYIEYLDMLEAVFGACAEALEPGGRIAVNVANLGRKPFRSLAADVTTILQDRLGLLLRGEVIWRKADGASGNCAWGSFQSASNPVLRDLTERVIIASKGRFDRALPKPERERRSLPFEDTIAKSDFMAWTTDVWDIPTESATRVGHPAPFPVELPQRLIELYTYRDDLVLDPFMGSGSTALAAINTHRNYVGFDTDPAYVEAAQARADMAMAERVRREESDGDGEWWFVPPPTATTDEGGFQARAVREGRMAKELARELLEASGFTDLKEGAKVAAGVEVNFVAKDRRGNTWYFDVSGAFSRGNDRAGLRRTDTLWKALGKAAVIREAGQEGYQLVLLTTDLPPVGSAGAKALAASKGRDKIVFDAIEMLSTDGQRHLQQYAVNGPEALPAGS